jgi:hypothetical protein
MYRRAVLCTRTFQIPVDFYYVRVGGRGVAGGGGDSNFSYNINQEMIFFSYIR